MVGEVLAERDPRLGPVDHQRQRPLGHSDRPHRVVDAPRAETGLRDHEPVALSRDEVRGRHPHVAEDDLGVPMLVVVAEDRQVPLDRQTRGVPRHEDHRLLAVRVGASGRSCP